LSTEFLTRIAVLETELAKLRAANSPGAIKQQLVNNPAGFFASLGLTPEEKTHVQRVTVADALGDQAPPEMRMLAQLGPQIAQQSQLAATIEALSRRVEELVVAPRKAEETRTSLNALIANKEAYPFLSAAIAKNPSLLDSKVKNRTGEAADIAKELEAEAKEFATAFGYQAPAQPASDANAETNKDAQSTQSKPAPLAGAQMIVPPIPGATVGPLTPEEDKQLKEEFLRKQGWA